MKIVDLSFITKINKQYAQKTGWQDTITFFKRGAIGNLLAPQVANTLESKMLNEVDEQKRQELLKYQSVMTILKDLPSQIQESLQYKQLNCINDIEEIQFNCSFHYEENTEYSVEDIIRCWIFDDAIEDASMMKKNITNMYANAIYSGKVDKEKINEVIKMYEHIIELLEEAKKTVQYNVRDID